MTRFADYATKNQTIRTERRDGILQMTFHTDGGPLQWGLLPHAAFPQAFRDVGADPENKVVILTGTGDVFSGPQAAGGAARRPSGSRLLELGLVSELLRRPALLPRAWALAEQIARQHALLLRYTRVPFTQPLKKQLVDYLGYGLALEGLSLVDRTVTPGA